MPSLLQLDAWAGIAPEMSHTVASRRRGFVILTALYFGCTFALCCHGFITEGLAPTRFIGITAMVFYVGMLAAVRRGVSLTLPAFLMLAATFSIDMIYASMVGGAGGPGAALLISVPFTAAFLLGGRAALASSGLCVVGIWALYVLVDRVANPAVDATAPVVLCLIVLCVTFYTIAFERVTRRLATDVQDTLALAEAARREAEASSAAKSSFLAMISHELRTPMNGVIGMTDVLSSTPLDDQQRGYLDTIGASGSALLSVINDLLDFTKMDAGHIEVTPAPFDMRVLLDQVVLLLKPEATKKGVALSYDVDPDLNPRLLGDGGKLRQIVLNLIGNALKFTAEGSVAIEVTKRPGGIVVTVTDTGIGVDPSKHEAIFDAFQQADTDTTRLYGGTGLGLSISRKLANAMGGTLTIESALGDGATFTLDLPLDVAAPADRPQEPAPTEPQVAQERRLLIAEDNPVNRQVIGAMLAKSGYALRFAEDGIGAVDAYETAGPNGFDAVIMDINMPTLDGYGATERIRAMEAERGWPPTFIVALTAHAGSEAARRSREVGMDEHLTKPLRKTDLDAVLDRLGNEKAAGRTTGTKDKAA